MSREIYKTRDSQVSVIKEGHKYEVVLENGLLLIDFQDGPVKEVGGRNGFQNEELIAILIDRMNVLNAEFPSEENLHAIQSLQTALNALELRTKRREARGVEGERKA